MDDAQHYARMIAKALHADVEPDDRVSLAGPTQKSGFYVVPRTEHTTPLWRLYEPAGRAIADEVERKIEEATLPLLSPGTGA